MGYREQLPRGPEAGSIARSQLSAWFSGRLEQSELERAKLLTSELVNNAVLHGQGRIFLLAELDDDRLLVEVVDQGGGFEHEARQRDFDDLHGVGLAVVESEASSWGIREGTTHVWFELERPGPRLG